MEPKFDETIEEVKVVKALTTKEIKAKHRPEFEKYPENYYPTKVFDKFGFKRHCCPKCNHFYWRKTELRDTCGDSNCVGSYTFIGRGTGIGREGKKITYADAWKGFEKSFTNARIPCTSIERYPVVARWRNDVDYVAAGIYCFQPYCVTGELDPPANPLICPQFSVRFNDLDNIGLTGRHYSGFIMLGIQVFNYPDKYVFFKEECVEFNYLWLTEELKIDPNEITFIEDVWAGGGNLGPSIEYFVNGLEVGNMVFMQYKTFPNGDLEELPIKIIDTGIGLERIPWLINGTPTSYVDTFRHALGFLLDKLNMKINNEVWEKLGPYTCQLNIDEVENIDKTWEEISKKINLDVATVKNAISPIKDLYIVLDHTRTVMMIVNDGSLPSNVGGGSNVRNILRRVFAILRKNDWFDKENKKKLQKLSMEDFISLFEYHKKDLGELYGAFPEYKSFSSIIEMEYERWISTDGQQKSQLEKKLKKTPVLTIDDWIIAMTSWGIPADAIAQLSGQAVPGNLYYEIAQRQERITKANEVILYNTTHLPETENLSYNLEDLNQFNGKIVDIFANINDSNKRNIVILDRSAFYPTSGGQQNDLGSLHIDGENYVVVNCEKVGKCVLHILNKELPNPDNIHYLGKEAVGSIEIDRRNILRNHHTATHIVFASCRRILGPHVWQNGAKKTIDQAHLDITHFTSISKEQEMQIENEANKIIIQSKSINKFFMNKAEAEKEYGFRLYQGGVVPGNQLRVVKIADTDVEACCGTHCDNTSEVGWIRLLKTCRISDGIVRLYFVAGTKVIERLNEDTKILNDLIKLWNINKQQIPSTAERFFKECNKLEDRISKKDDDILSLQIRYVIDGPRQLFVIPSDQHNPTVYFSKIPPFAETLKQKGKGVVFVGDTFIYSFIAEKGSIDVEKLSKAITVDKPVEIKVSNKLASKDKKSKGGSVDDIVSFCYNGAVDYKKVLACLEAQGFYEFKI